METPWYKDKLLLNKHKKGATCTVYTIKEPLPDIKLSKKIQGDPQVTESCSGTFHNIKHSHYHLSQYQTFTLSF